MEIESLSYAAIELQPRNFDFGTGHGHTWRYREAVKCEDCGTIVEMSGGPPECRNCGNGYLYAEGPMMNTWWPLPDSVSSPNVDSAQLLGLPLCIVEGTPGIGLALTGGGMDLSWEITEAYIRLGYYPPATIRLPRLAGMRASERNLKIVKALTKSLEAVKSRAVSQLSDLSDLIGRLENEVTDE